MAGVVKRIQRFRLRHLAQTRLWLLPLICVLAGIGLAVALLSVDRSSGFHIVSTHRVVDSAGDPNQRRDVPPTALHYAAGTRDPPSAG